MIDPTNRNTALATALVDELGRCGVRQAIASPGSRSSPLVLALDASEAIDLRIVLDERVAGFVALGAGLASGRPVAIACTSGSAAANLLPATVEADQAGVPLLLLTADRPTELRGIGAGQAIDQIKLFGDSVRWFSEVGSHDGDDTGLLHYRSTACRAVAEAEAGRGPVHLNLAWRDPLGPEPAADVTAEGELARGGRPDGRPLTRFAAGREPSAELISAAVDAVGRAERPLIVAGRLPEAGFAGAITELAERIEAPILADPTSQMRFGPHDRSAVVAAYDLILRDPPSTLEPDLLIRFGDLPTSKPLRRWLEGRAGEEQLVIDPPGHWNEPTRTGSLLIRTDAGSLARALADRLDLALADEWLSRWVAAERRAQAAIDSVLDAETALNEPAVHRAIGSQLTDGDQLLLASSMPIRDAEAFARGGETDVRVFSNRGANGIDGLVSTAAGLALGGGRPTWALLGDLALAHDLGGLAAIALADDPIRLIVLDNGGGHIFDFLPQAGQVAPERFERLFTTPAELDLSRVAELFGLAYLPIAAPGDLAAASRHDRVLAHVTVDPGPNVDLHERIAATVAAQVTV